MNTHSIKTLALLLAVLSMMLACALPELPTQVTANQTSDPGLIQTIVVATAGAAQTQTALVQPPATDTSTATLLPSSTPTATPTATATIIFIIPTKTYTPTATNPPTATGQSGGAGCEVVSQSPANDTAYGGRERFNAQWTIRNTSTETWQAGSVDFFHSSGRDMHEADILDLPRNVRAGGDITLTVEMRVPAQAGSYTSSWTLGTQRDTLCTVSVRIVVR